MGICTKYSGNLKAIVLAGAMALVALNAVAQQEVDPDHFDGSQSIVTPKNRVTKSRKQATSSQNTNTASKPSTRQVRVNKNVATPKVVTVAAH